MLFIIIFTSSGSEDSNSSNKKIICLSLLFPSLLHWFNHQSHLYLAKFQLSSWLYWIPGPEKETKSQLLHLPPVQWLSASHLHVTLVALSPWTSWNQMRAANHMVGRGMLSLLCKADSEIYFKFQVKFQVFLRLHPHPCRGLKTINSTGAKDRIGRASKHLHSSRMKC